jgi:hypothetical protein
MGGKMTCQHPLQSLPKVLEQVEPICTLSGLRSATSSSRGIVSSTITTHEPDFRVRAHPSRDGFDGSVRQEVNDVVALQIYEDGAERSSTSEREII